MELRERKVIKNYSQKKKNYNLYLINDLTYFRNEEVFSAKLIFINKIKLK